MSRFLSLLLLSFILISSCSSYVYADVIGALRFVVKNGSDEKPVSGVKIKLKDSANVRPDVVLTTDKDGVATVSQLDARSWQVTIATDNYEVDSRQVLVSADTVTDIEILLQPIKEKIIRVTGERKLVHTAETTASTHRDSTFIKTFPANADNKQSLSKVLRGNPGFVEDSVNQVHPRGEHSATSIFINGFELPGALQGRAGQIISAETVQSVDLLTGAYAPEYGGETAAILNVNLRSGTIKPFQDLTLQGGSFNTGFGSVTFGGQAGPPIEASEDQANVARRFGYLINLSGRQTDNALEPPQPDNQTAHNKGFSQILFGNFDYQAGMNDRFTLTANSTPAYTQIANRTGLPDSFAPFGQGYGYGGALSRVAAGALGVVSQQAGGQDINQRDANTFGVLNWRHTFNQNLFSLLSVASLHTGQYLTNNNPAVNLFALPGDNGIEFNPSLFRDGYHTEVQGSLTLIAGNHTFKAGLLDDEQSGKESYQFVPASQLALDQLAATDPRLAPVGTFQTDAFGNPILDNRGLQMYTPNPGATVPTLFANRSGFYRAAYLQDTWRANSFFTVNYGVRYDRYRQSQNLGQPTVDQSNLSPRVNMSFAVTPGSAFRLSYNRLFIQPPLAQGAILGLPIQPETLNQYEASYEFQVGRGQAIKLASYYKDIRHQIDTGLLFFGTQIGAFTSVNFDGGTVRGQELSWEYNPPNKVGISSYLGYSYSIAKPFGFDNTGTPVPMFNDHDQRHTLGVGLANTWESGANVGANFYYGSGVASSPLIDDNRIPHSELNLHFGTGPVLFKSGKEGVGFALDVENLFDDRQVINFNSGFSGTRFQQGRFILFSTEGHF